MNNTKLTPLGRLILLLVALTVVAVAGAAGASATRPHARDWRCVQVRPGDTLWGLARASGAGDVRAGVYKITQHNGLPGATLSPGTAIWVPRGPGDLEEVDADRCPEPR